MFGRLCLQIALFAVLLHGETRADISIHELSASHFATNTVSGQVLDVIDSAPISTVILFDRSGGIPLYVDTPNLKGVVRGDLVTAHVVHQHWTYTTKSISITGRRPIPEPVEITFNELSRRICQPASIRGVLQSVRPDAVNTCWNWMSLATPGGTLPVAAREADFPIATLRPLLDAEIRLSGYAQPMVAWRAGLGLQFTPVKDYPIEVLHAPPTDIRDTSPFDSLQHPHRQRLSGLVLATSRERFFMKTTWGVCEVYVTEHPCAVSPGDQVTVAGFFNASFQGHRIEEARVQIDARDPFPADDVVRIGFNDLFNVSQGGEVMSLDHYHRTVTLAGEVKGTFLSPNGQKTVLLGDGHHTLLIDVSLFGPPQFPDIRPGATVEVTGLCHADFDRDSAKPAELQFRSFVVFPRAAGDIRVLAQPSWWSTGLLLSVIGVLLALLLGIGLWNRSLAVLSRRRAEQLSLEQLNVSKAELKISERTRIAVELHDALSQNLTGVSLQLDAVRRFADDDHARMLRHLDMAMRTLKSCRTELRNCLWDLRNRALEEPDLNMAIRQSISPFVGDARLEIQFDVPRERLSDDTTHALMRIIRELASNAVNHGQATVIRIVGATDDDRLLCSISDNGSGFDPQRSPGVAEGHFGLQGIIDRINQLHGEMKLTSSRHSGTTVSFSLKK